MKKKKKPQELYFKENAMWKGHEFCLQDLIGVMVC